MSSSVFLFTPTLHTEVASYGLAREPVECSPRHSLKMAWLRSRSNVTIFLPPLSLIIVVEIAHERPPGESRRTDSCRVASRQRVRHRTTAEKKADADERSNDELHRRSGCATSSTCRRTERGMSGAREDAIRGGGGVRCAALRCDARMVT
jgi:hypothetical protein